MSLKLNILRNPNPLEIKYAIEYHLYEFWKSWFTSGIKNIEYEEGEEFFKFSTNIPLFWLNGVLDTKFSSNAAEERIQENILYFKKKNHPFSWFTGPLTKPNDFRDLLIKNGFTLLLEYPGMAYNLKNLVEKQELDPNLEIIKVENDETLKVWNEVIISGYQIPEELPSDFLKNIYSKIFLNEDSSASAFLAYYNGKPVATSGVLYRGGVAGIYNIATIKEERGKGIGTTITLAALYEAKKLGYELVVLHSLEKGLNLYKRIGFKEYCKLQRFVWDPNSNE